MNCPKCKNIVSDDSKFCPNCGYNFKTKEEYTSLSMRKKYYILGTLLFIMYVLWLYSPSSSTKNYDVNSTVSTSTTESKSNSYDSKPEPVQTTNVSINNPFSKDDYAEINIKGTEFVEKVIPTNPDSYYRYYAAEDGKIYFVLNATLKNLKKDKEDMDKLVSANVYYDDGYKYHCMLLKDSHGTLDGLYEYVDPLQTENVKFAIQLPKAAQTDAKPIKVVFEMGTQKYEYICR